MLKSLEMMQRIHVTPKLEVFEFWQKIYIKYSHLINQLEDFDTDFGNFFDQKYRKYFLYNGLAKNDTVNNAKIQFSQNKQNPRKKNESDGNVTKTCFILYAHHIPPPTQLHYTCIVLLILHRLGIRNVFLENMPYIYSQYILIKECAPREVVYILKKINFIKQYVFD